MMDVGRKTKMEKTTAKHMSTAQMTVTALMTAITCILAPMALPIPISPVPNVSSSEEIAEPAYEECSCN